MWKLRKKFISKCLVFMNRLRYLQFFEIISKFDQIQSVIVDS